MAAGEGYGGEGPGHGGVPQALHQRHRPDREQPSHDHHGGGEQEGTLLLLLRLLLLLLMFLLLLLLLLMLLLLLLLLLLLHVLNFRRSAKGFPIFKFY